MESDQINPTELIEREITETEQKLNAVGKLGAMLITLAAIAIIVLFYKLSTLVSSLTKAETLLVWVSFGLLALVLMSGYTFMNLARYRKAIQTWKNQSLKDYEVRHRED